MSADDSKKAGLRALASQPFEKQGKQFLNAYWVNKFNFSSDQEACEKIWQYTSKFVALNKSKGKDGCELDEFEAHQFLEKEVGAMTVKDMREALAEIDVDFNLKISLIEFLIFHYNVKDWEYLVDWTPSGSAAQQRLLGEVQAQMSMAQKALAEATEKREKSKAEAENFSVASVASAEAAKISEKAAKEQHDARIELEAQEKAKADALAEEEVKASDESLSTVKRNRAKAQVAILKSEDSQPLRTARITASAAERKALKAFKSAEKAAREAKEASELAEEAALSAEKAMAEADSQVATLTDKLEEAKAACSGSGTEDGTLWWLDREFEESLRFMGPKQRAKAEAARAASRDKAGNTN